MESAYNRKQKSEKKMCKHCKSTAHSSLQHGKHYKGFKDEKKAQREQKHMKMFGVESGKGNPKKHKKASPALRPIANPFGTESEVSGKGGGAGGRNFSTTPGQTALGGINTTRLRKSSKKA